MKVRRDGPGLLGQQPITEGEWEEAMLTLESERYKRRVAERQVQDGHFVAMMLVRRLGGRAVFTEYDLAQAPKGTLMVTPVQDPKDPLARSLVITVVDAT